jgi:hypothetical protein
MLPFDVAIEERLTCAVLVKNIDRSTPEKSAENAVRGGILHQELAVSLWLPRKSKYTSPYSQVRSTEHDKRRWLLKLFTSTNHTCIRPAERDTAVCTH